MKIFSIMKQKLAKLKDPVLREKVIYFALSFALPCLVMGVVFALQKVYPFGDRQIFIIDLRAQYYPMLSDYWHKLREGASLLWSWNAGMGHNYWTLIAYYLASPLNLLIVLFPHAWLREVMTAMLLVKLGCAGLFTACYLRYTHRRVNIATPIFALCFSLCAFILGYYWNTIWIDTFALLPLTMLGVHALVREGKYRLFIVSLALSIWCSYYLGIFTCIFTAIYFFAACYIEKTSWRVFLRRLSWIAACSAIAVGLTAVLTVPAYIALQGTSAAGDQFPAKLKFFESFVDIFGNSLAFTTPTFLEGLPNVYSGVLTLLLGAAFIRSPKVSKREKIAYGSILAFLVFCLNQNALNYMWHGFHYPRQLPYRFSFLVSFVLAGMAFKAFTYLEDLKLKDLLAMSTAAVAFLCFGFFGSQDISIINRNVLLCGVYLLAFAVYINLKDSERLKKFINNRTLGWLLLVVVTGEVLISANIGVTAAKTTEHSNYPNRYERVQELFEMREPMDNDFYRTEYTSRHISNDPLVYGAPGVSFFSSSMPANTNRFMQGLGVSGGINSRNRVHYTETTPLSNAFLNIRYLISRDGYTADGGAYWDQAGKINSSLLLENKRYLPLGFMVNAKTAEYKGNSAKPFQAQNDLFRLSTGLNDDLITLFAPTGENHKNCSLASNGSGKYTYTKNSDAKGTLQWDFTAPIDGPVYIYCKIQGLKAIRIIKEDKPKTLNVNETIRPRIICAGNFEKGEVFSVAADVSSQKGAVTLYAGYVDAALFDRGYGLLADEPLRLTKFTYREVEGTVDALKDGLLYTSIPYEKGWTAYVDGEKQEIIPIDNCMAALRLEEGTHSVRFHYYDKNLTYGLIISLISLAAFAVILLLDTRKRSTAPQKKEAKL